MKNEKNSSLHFTLGILAMKNELNSSLHFTLGILEMKNEMIYGLHFYFGYSGNEERNEFIESETVHLFGDASSDKST
jgi:hypothetical protein